MFASRSRSRFRSATSYSLSVIPMDLFCLSSVSCRVIDYGQFSKYPTANTSFYALSIFRRRPLSALGQHVFAFCETCASANVCFSLQSKLCTLFRLPFRYLCISASIRWATLFHCFPMLFLVSYLSLAAVHKSFSKYNLIDFVDFARREWEIFQSCVDRTFWLSIFHVGSFLLFTLTHCVAAIYPNTHTQTKQQKCVRKEWLSIHFEQSLEHWLHFVSIYQNRENRDLHRIEVYRFIRMRIEQINWQTCFLVESKWEHYVRP